MTLRDILILLGMSGLVLSMVGFSLYSSYLYPKSQKIDIDFSGFAVSQLEPPYIFEQYMYFGINLDPPTLYFNFGYTPLRNGTYVTYLFFPFHIGNLTDEVNLLGGEILLENLTGDFGSLIVVNATVQGREPYHAVQVIATYEIETTFIENNRGDLRIVLPFGYISTIRQDEDINGVVPWSDLNDVSFNEITVSVGLPSDYDKIQTVPFLTVAPQPNPFLYQDTKTLQWIFSEDIESIVIFCEDPDEKVKFQNYLQWSGLLIGIGIPLGISSFVELVKLKTDMKRSNIKEKAINKTAQTEDSKEDKKRR